MSIFEEQKYWLKQQTARKNSAQALKASPLEKF